MERGSAGQLLAVNTFVWVTTALYAPFIGAYYAEQGITPFQVGVLTAIGPVVSTLIQPLWAYISDRLGKRRRVLIIGCILEILFPVMLQGRGVSKRKIPGVHSPVLR